MRGAHNKQHEVFQDALEVRVSWNGNRTIHQCSNERPDKTWHGLCPSAHHLQTECQAVNVRAIVRDNAER